MPDTDDVARDFTNMLRAGQFEAAGDRYWSCDVTSLDPVEPCPVSGREAVRRKCEARFGAARVDDIGIDGPFVTGDQFALFLDLIIDDPVRGGCIPLTEIALYTVRNGQITEERHFYG